MKPALLAALVASVSASSINWEDFSDTVTQTIQRVHYTCPCNGEESIVTTTNVPSSWPAKTYTNELSTAYSASTTSDFTTTSMTTIGSSSTSITTSTTVPTITAGEPFAITPQLAPAGKLKKRADSYVGFSGNQAVIVTDPSSSWAFKITPEGALTTYNYGYSVGTSSTQQAAVITYFTSTDGSPAQANSWSIVNGVLIYPGAGFCLSANNLMVMYYNDSPPSGCQLLQLAADSSSSSYNLNVTPQASTSGSQPSTATSIPTSPIPSSSPSTPTPSALAQNTTCLSSVPSGSCFGTVSTNSTSPKYSAACDQTWAGRTWGSLATFPQCMAQCDARSATLNATDPYGCVGFVYNAATTTCFRSANCWLVYRNQAPVVRVGANEDLLTDVWTVALLPEFYN